MIKILSTFRFSNNPEIFKIDPSETANWNTYQDPIYGFRFSYPPSSFTTTTIFSDKIIMDHEDGDGKGKQIFQFLPGKQTHDVITYYKPANTENNSLAGAYKKKWINTIEKLDQDFYNTACMVLREFDQWIDGHDDKSICETKNVFMETMRGANIEYAIIDNHESLKLTMHNIYRGIIHIYLTELNTGTFATINTAVTWLTTSVTSTHERIIDPYKAYFPDGIIATLKFPTEL